MFTFVTFCLNYETSLINESNKNSNLNNNYYNTNNSTINLPKLSTTGLNVIIFSDGSSAYLPYFISSFSRRLNNIKSPNSGVLPIIKFVLSRSDLFFFLQTKS